MKAIGRRRFGGLVPALAALLTMASLAPRTAQAMSSKITIAFTPTAAAEGLFNAQAEGFFAKHGLDTAVLMQRNSVGVVAAVQSGAAQIGVPAAGVFVGAVQHGLPYVALACQSLFGPGTNVLAVIVRKGVAIKTPQDFVGKRVAVPGLRGGTQIMFMEWLRENGVDPAKVTYVEVNYPQQADILRGHTVDAVVTSEPYLSRIVDAGLGTAFSHLNDTKEDMPDAFFMAKKSWVKAHPDWARAFQAALAEGVAFAGTNEEQTAANAARFLDQNAALVKQSGRQHLCRDDLATHVEQLNTVMLGLKLIKAPLDPKTVVWPTP
jgi:NitT/TauT family transport system substrate-binding protein